MNRTTRCLGLAFVLTYVAAPARSQTTYSFESSPGTHAFSFSNYDVTANNPLGDLFIYAPITLHDSADNTDTAAVLRVFTTQLVSTTSPVILTRGHYDQPGLGGHFFIFDAQTNQQLLNAYYGGDIVGSFGINSAVFSGNLTVNDTSLSLSLWPAHPTFSFSLTAISPALSIFRTGTLTDFTADFSAQVTDVPEPIALACLTFLPLILRRPRQRAATPGTYRGRSKRGRKVTSLLTAPTHFA